MHEHTKNILETVIPEKRKFNNLLSLHGRSAICIYILDKKASWFICQRKAKM